MPGDGALWEPGLPGDGWVRPTPRCRRALNRAAQLRSTGGAPC